MPLRASNMSQVGAFLKLSCFFVFASLLSQIYYMAELRPSDSQACQSFLNNTTNITNIIFAGIQVTHPFLTSVC